MKTEAHLIAIVPRLPPAVDGLGDYGLNLARQLGVEFDLATNFIVGDPGWNGGTFVEGFAVNVLEKRSPAAMLKLLPNGGNYPGTVLLHYVGYGYARRGCPVWLVEALEQWRKSGTNRRLLAMFHELYAFGPIWTSAFWTSPLQRNLAKRLVCLSDDCFTSKQGYAEIIVKLSQGKHGKVKTMPVFSNLGEPEFLSPIAERPKRLVVFGGRGPRTRVYQRSLSALEQTCKKLGIEEIIDVGPPLGFSIKPVNGTPVICLGIKPPQEISKLLSASAVGFFDYHPEFLAKSTIFAAYCAHKLLPVGVFYEARNVDGLEVGKHYWLGDRHQEIMNWSAGQDVADNAYYWYQNHRLSIQASLFANCLTAC